MNLDTISKQMTSAFLEGKKYTPAGRDRYTDFACRNPLVRWNTYPIRR